MSYRLKHHASPQNILYLLIGYNEDLLCKSDTEVAENFLWKITLYSAWTKSICSVPLICKVKNAYLLFDYQKMEVPGTHHHLLVQQDMKHMELPQGWSLDLHHNLEQMLHLNLGGIVEMQTKHIQPGGQNNRNIIQMAPLVKCYAVEKDGILMCLEITPSSPWYPEFSVICVHLLC